MAQKRKSRVLVFDIRITVYTDFMQEFYQNMMRGVVSAWRQYEMAKGRITKIECNERVLDGKTFAEIK